MSSARSVDPARRTEAVRLVVDANVVVQIVLAGSNLGPLEGHDMIAPPIMRSEALSTLSEMAYRGEMPADAARVAASRLAAVPVTLDRPDALDEAAFELARSHGWAKTYDAEYVALARIHGLALVTLDQRLRRGAAHLVSMPLVADLEDRA
jgi:predicted nucleic acid-binding protein